MSDDQYSPHGAPSEQSSYSSGTGSVSETRPLPPPEPVFQEFFDSALVFGVLKPPKLLDIYPVRRVLEELSEDSRERVADIVHACIGTMRSVILKRYNVERFADDIQAGIEEDPDVAKRFVDSIGVDFFMAKMPLADLYRLVMGTGWMLEDTPQHRGFAASMCRSLVNHKAFGSLVRTLEHIFVAIGTDALMSDAMPQSLRKRLMDAAHRGVKKYKGHYISEYIFDKDDGVPFEEMAAHLPVEPLARPFAAFVNLLDLAETGIDRPSELPPSEHPAMQAQPPSFAIPRPPTFNSFSGASPEDDGDAEDA